jgi:hypothetical protein
VKRTRAEKKLRKAARAAHVVVSKHAELEQQAVALIDQQAAAIRQRDAVIDGLRLTLRHVYFGAFLGKALGDEQKLTEALMTTTPEWFKGYEEAPWMALSSS